MIDTEFLNQQANCLTVDKVYIQSVYSRVAFRKVGFSVGQRAWERSRPTAAAEGLPYGLSETIGHLNSR